MAHVTLQSLVVITVLQLCRAEIPEIQGTWYSANAINDGYSPKPISELFTTDNSPIYSSTFSVTKPIVVQPLPITNNINFIPDLSTNAKTTVTSPPNRTQTYNTEIPTVTSTILSTLEPSITFTSTPAPPSTFSTIQSLTSSTIQTPSTSSTLSTLSTISSLPTLSTLSSFEPQTVTQAQTSGIIINNNQDQQSTLQSNDNTNSLPPQTIRIEPPTISIPSTTQSPNSIPNYFVIYQQAPQNIQTFSQSQPQPETQNISQPSINAPITPSTLPPSISTISSTFPSSTVPVNPSIQTTLVSTITNPCVTRNPLTSLRPTIVSSAPVLNSTPTTRIPPNFMIRVVAPKGSITNVKFVATTTKRPTTRRTKKPKRNTYEGCLNSCKGRKDPLCANPLAALIIDPNTLKGFPSICHLACHNSYKDIPYEKLVDGRCSRLRTRIMQVNSNTKLRRDELLKSQYSIVSNADQTIVEVSKQ
ncbi:mucin-5AC-like [Galleria mellonella]|uniref:Mucin-5AC-like n=1 Tax=Galleria mellonella TaxID=7137 RepID=A0A6J1W852_GALME|nr:mucin-5AC-like [Galleria mellonella]